MKRLLLFVLLVTCGAFSQVSPQIQGSGAPTNPCYNGGQQYYDQTNHILYNCSIPGQNWTNIGVGNPTVITTACKTPTVVASLAGVCGATKGTIATVTDGSSASDCTSGGGSTAVTCLYGGASWAAVGGGGGSGTVGNCTAAGNAYYSASGTTTTCDTNITDNGSGVITFTNTGPNIIIPAGTVTNPSLNFANQASNTGLYAPGAATFGMDILGAAKYQFAASALNVTNTGSYCFSQTGLATGGSGGCLSLVGSNANQEYLSINTPLVDSGKCQINALAISNATTTLCTFTLPNAATALRVDCRFAQIYSTATTLGLGYTFAQTPTLVSMSADIKTTNTNTATEATATTANTSNNVVLTGATPGATGTFQAEFFGTFTSSATSGTLLITAIAGAASDLTMTGGCYVH